MRFRPARDASQFGSRPTGLLLSAIAGHSLCLGVFGMPSATEVQAGAVLHGEAGVRPWKPEIATYTRPGLAADSRRRNSGMRYVTGREVACRKRDGATDQD